MTYQADCPGCPAPGEPLSQCCNGCPLKAENTVRVTVPPRSWWPSCKPFVPDMAQDSYKPGNYPEDNE